MPFMNSAEKQELRELIKLHIGEVVYDQNLQLTAIHGLLKSLDEGNARIERRLDKLNGTVADHVEKIHRLEVEGFKHVIDCPQKKRILALDEKITEEVEKLDKKITEEVRKLDTKFTGLIEGIEKIILFLRFFIKWPWFAPISIGTIVIGILIVIFELFIKHS